MRPGPRPVIAGLDVLRFMAALLVVFYHLCVASWADPTTDAARIVGGAVAFPGLYHFTWAGWVGVEIFFVISGLVIAYSADGASPYKFIRSRVVRLYPAVWICATLTLIALLATHADFPHTARAYMASLTLFPLQPWIDSVYWTLGIEMAFYALIFVMLAADQYHRLETISWVLGGLSSFYWVAGGLFAPDFVQAHLWNRMLELSLLPYGCFFAIGSMTYLASRRGISLTRCAAIGIFMAAGWIEIAFKTAHSNSIFQAHETAFQPHVVFLAALVFILASMRLKLNNAGLGRAFRILGLTTYPLYLLHDIIGAAAMKYAVAFGFAPVAALAVAITACVAISVTVATLAEPPLQAMLRRALMHVEAGARRLSWCDFLFSDTRLVDFSPAVD